MPQKTTSLSNPLIDAKYKSRSRTKPIKDVSDTQYKKLAKKFNEEMAGILASLKTSGR